MKNFKYHFERNHACGIITLIAFAHSLHEALNLVTTSEGCYECEIRLLTITKLYDQI